VGLACALLAGVLLWPLPASGGYGWDIGIAVGYAGLGFAATLYLFPLRGEGLPHRRLFTLSQHRRLGWITLILSLVHVAMLLIVQPQVGHYLLPSAPVYMLFGTIALIALATLVATGLSARKTMHKAPPRGAAPRAQHAVTRPGAFVQGSSVVVPPARGPSAAARPTPLTIPTHAVLAALLLACLGIHIVGSGQLADRPAKIITLCLLLALPLVWAALWRKGPRDRGRLPTLVPSVVATIILFLLPLPIATPQLLRPAATPLLLPVSFPHEKHTTVGCVLCHHNFTDKTGAGSCLDCHRSTTRTDLKASAEATFHTFCRNCHTQLAETTSRHGPTRACSACHARPPSITAATPAAAGGGTASALTTKRFTVRAEPRLAHPGSAVE
jgi:hypothetical protein